MIIPLKLKNMWGGIQNVYKSIGINGAKNLLPITLANIKANNTSGTWNDNQYTIAGVTFTVNTDSNGNVLSITADGTASAAALLILKIGDYININTQYMLSGCPNGGGDNKYRQYVYDLHAFNKDDNGDGVVFTYNGNYLSNLVWRIAIYNGYTANNLTFYPMIRLVSDTDSTFQPYAKTNLELTNQIDSITDVTDVNDNSPYLYKISSHNAIYDKLVGGSFGWNSILHNGDFTDTSYWGSYGQMVITNISNNTATITSTSDSGYSYERDFFQTNISVNKEHKYLIKASIKPTINMNMTFIFGNETPNKLITANQWNDMYGINIPNSTSVSFVVHTNTLMTNGQSYQLKNIYITDLTLLCGTEIADYVYSLEQSTAGSGIAWLKSYGFFTKDYYPYNVGELQSVKTSGKKVVGFNQWDEEWEIGDIDANTGAKKTGNYFISKNYIQVLSGNYYIKLGKSNAYGFIYKYNKDKQYLGYINCVVNQVFEIPQDTSYILFLVASYGTTYNHDICINISDTDKNGTYEPYTSITYPLGNDELRGIPKLVNNQLVCDGDIKTSDGVISRKYTEPIDLGTLNWVKHDTDLIFIVTVPNSINPIANGSENAICSKYINYVGSYSTFKTLDKAFQYNNLDFSSSKYIIVRDSSYTDAATFKTAMSGVYLVAEKETPTIEASTPFTSPQMVYSDGTEEYIDTRDVPIPVGGDREYIDIPEWMDNKYFNDLRANIMLNYAESQSF